MFGLGPWELIIILGVVMLLGGAPAVRKLVGFAKSANKAKNELTGEAILGKIMDDDAPAKKRKTKKKKKRKRRKKQPSA